MKQKINIIGYIGIIVLICLIIVGIVIFMPREDEVLAVEISDIEIKVGLR